MPEGPMPEGPMPEGATPEGPMPEGATPEGPMPEGATPEGAMDEDAMNEKPQYLCMKCAKTHDVEGEFCPVHPDEPLLDGSNEEVKLELMKTDDRAKTRWIALFLILFGVVSMGIGFTIWFAILGADKFRYAGRWIAMAIILGGTLLGGFLGRITFKPKYREWTRTIDPDPD